MKSIVLITLLIGVSACSRTYITVPTQPTPVETTPKVITSKIEYRVLGNASSARIRYANERDGLVQTVTTLPFFASFNTTLDNLFLNIEATPLNYSVVQNPFLSVQIFVNGDLFRESSSNEFFLNPVSVNGTWRR